MDLLPHCYSRRHCRWREISGSASSCLSNHATGLAPPAEFDKLAERPTVGSNPSSSPYNLRHLRHLRLVQRVIAIVFTEAGERLNGMAFDFANDGPQYHEGLFDVTRYLFH